MNDSEPTVDHELHAAMVSQTNEPWAYDDFTAAEDQPGLATGPASLAFIWAAIRRRAWFWCATAVAGLLIGFGLYAAFPPAYQASTSLFLTYAPSESPGTAITDYQAVAGSHAVAALAMHRLGLRINVSSFLKDYTVTVETDRVLLITVRAPSVNDAVTWANAVATSFLRFRADQVETEQALLLGSLDQQMTRTRQQLRSVNGQILQLSAQSASPVQRARLSSLQTQRSRLASELTALENAVTGDQTVTQAETTSAITDSRVLDAAVPVPSSRLKRALLYPAAGLIVGLALGMGAVAVEAVTSDRLRRRDDIAQALGTDIAVSIGRTGLAGRLPGMRSRTTTRDADIRRVAAHLRSVMPVPAEGASALAVVPADDSRVAALSLVSLAVFWAQQGKRVVLADLCSGAPLATLLRVKDPGVNIVNVQDAQLEVAIPDDTNAVPIGPFAPSARFLALGRESLQSSKASAFTQAVSAASTSADYVLTLVTVDPTLGSDHLRTWATDAVVVVTAGRSSWTRINATGEMIRLAGIRLVSAVLTGADKADESLGLARTAQSGGGSLAVEGLASP